MKELFSIGEVAKLFRINIRTLRYYNQIGLLQPSVTDDQTGYRYYSTQQFERLNTILYLRALGMPLKSIMRFFEKKNTETMMKLLIEQQEVTETKIQQLRRVKRKLAQRIATLEDAATVEFEKIRETFISEREIAMLRKAISPDDDLEHPIRELEQVNSLGPIIFLGKIGLSISREDLQNRKFDLFSGIFLIFEEGDEAGAPVERIPKGDYLTVRFSGTHQKSAQYYKQLTDYIDQNGYVISGDSVEITLVDAGLTSDNAQFVTEIQIPVDRKF